MFIYKRTPRRTRLGDLCPSPTATATSPPPPPRRPSPLSRHASSIPPSRRGHPPLPLSRSFPRRRPPARWNPAVVPRLHSQTPRKQKGSSTGPPGGSASCRTHAAESPLRAVAAVGFCLDLHASETKFIGRTGWCGSNNVHWYFYKC